MKLFSVFSVVQKELLNLGEIYHPRSHSFSKENVEAATAEYNEDYIGENSKLALYRSFHSSAKMLSSTKMVSLNKKGQHKFIEEIRRKDNRLLLAVTGGVASGKSTVAQMLERLGAPLIDFDALSRVVVEPGKPAWRGIVAYFGEQILFDDKTLNRKKLAQIVFRDPEKRKKLESLVHPKILEEFIRLVKEYTTKDPSVIIQAIVPLLFEVKLQSLFHKVLLVYVSEQVQIERLIKRDGISREMAINILKSQLPIEEKKTLADFIVDNSGSLEETRRQVEEIWEKLKKVQKERRGL